jgi:hypothetical protein
LEKEDGCSTPGGVLRREDCLFGKMASRVHVWYI